MHLLTKSFACKVSGLSHVYVARTAVRIDSYLQVKHTHTHIPTKHIHTLNTFKKQSLQAAVTQLLLPSEPALGFLAPLRHLSLVQANPLGAGLVTRRRTIQVSWREVAEPKVPHNDPNTTKRDKDSWPLASPVYTTYSSPPSCNTHTHTHTLTWYLVAACCMKYHANKVLGFLLNQ